MNRDDVLSIVRQFTGHENIIAVPRILIELTGDPILAMMLNQLLYWSAQKEWIYKSLEDWNEERYGIKSHIATLMGKETNYEWRKVKE